ncbi:ABC transporter permease [Kutzneria sp. NPDC051319]|uniref:ABC transporter permease n=1 Tax=Kutzneria sp. NPDC051319 TaxID=3155047 RepID=UPI003432FB1B
MNAIKLGVARGRIELRQVFTVPSEVLGYFLPTVFFMAVLAFLRFVPVAGAGFSYGTLILTGLIGSSLCFSGLSSMTQTLAAEREDGTLVRARALPNGVPAYLIGKVLMAAGFAVASVAVLLVYALLLFDGVALPGLGSWLKLVAVILLGLLATLLLGAVLGSLFPNPRVSAVVSVPLLALLAVSGILYPITVLPGWVQWIAQVFPMYWLGLGVRSTLLPDSALVTEIGQSWRGGETFAVLGAWALLGLVLAPIVLRRMTRRGKGARIGKAKQRIG